MRMTRVARILSAGAALILSTAVVAQVRPTLPPPTGPLAVGRMTYYWTDSARAEPLSPREGARREIKVHVWYPAAPAQARRPTVPYIESFPSITQAVSRQALEGLFRPASYAALEQSLPATHTVEGAAMPATRDKHPVLLFSHGLGNTSELYTAEIEDLVSHGYVVAAINHTYEAAFVVFPRDRVVVYARQAWQDESQKPNGYVQYVKKRIEEAWVPDLRFVLGQLERLDAAPSSPLSGRLDLTRVGAFGHSMGGLAIVRACQLESRLLACMNQDADIAGSPFIEPQSTDGLRQPLLFFTAATSNVFRESFVRPSDETLKQMNTTRARYNADVARVQQNQSTALASVKGGSYRVYIDIPSFIHRTFSDLTLLATDEPQKGESLANFRIAQSYTRAFFDKHLRGLQNTVLDAQSSRDARVRVDRWTKH
jgi:hypothetical protein